MYIFIVNPASRSGHASQIWTEIETLLKERNILYRVYFTSHRGHGTKLAQQLTKDLSSCTTLIVVGGDGTVNEVLNGIEHPEHIILGYIPTGSGNDFAKGMALPSDPQKALTLEFSNILKKTRKKYGSSPSAPELVLTPQSVTRLWCPD